jgi:hypothetical protein
MGSQRIRFAYEDEHRPPTSVWVTRALITSLIVGTAGVAHIFFGFRFF